MQIALLSDIHSNVQALNACLLHAEERGAQRYAFLGDFVGYGGDPRGVVQVIADYVALGAVALVGSVGQPRDHNPRAAYTMFDTTREQITFHRVAYDVAAAADKIRESGLPASLAYRVALGI